MALDIELRNPGTGFDIDLSGGAPPPPVFEFWGVVLI